MASRTTTVVLTIGVVALRHEQALVRSPLGAAFGG